CKNLSVTLVLRHVDGDRTVADLFEAVGDGLSPPAVVYVLTQLANLGLLGDGAAAAVAGDDLAYWHALGVDERPDRRLAAAAVGVVSAAPRADAALICAALPAAGPGIAAHG